MANISKVVRLALAFCLFAAAGLKGHGIATDPLAQDSLLLPPRLLIAIIEIEIVLGLWLLSGWAARGAWLASIGFFGSLAGVSLYLALRGQTSCGCFGLLSVNPWFTTILDAAALAALSFSFPPKNAIEWPRCTRLRWVSFAAPAALALLTVLWVLAEGPPQRLEAITDNLADGASIVLDPALWEHRPFPLLGHMEIDQDLSVGDWTVVLYRRSCASCRDQLPDFLERLKLIRERAMAARIALVEVPGAGASQPMELSAGLADAWGHLRAGRRWIVQTPLFVRVHQGIVKEYTNSFDDTQRAFVFPKSS